MKFDKNKILLDAFVNIPNYVFIKDRDLIYQACNQKFANFSGFKSHKQIEGLTDFEMPWSNQHADLYRDEDLEIIHSGKSFELKEVPMKINNEEKILLVSKAALFDEDKNVIGILGVYIDITQQKTLEHQLKIARNRAVTASRSKSEFIANMSHDIRTPVTGILAMSQHMINSVHKFKATLTPNNILTTLNQLMCIVENNTELLMKATNELLTLCNNILEVVQIESGRSNKPVEIFDLRQLVQHTIDLLLPVAHNKGLKLSAQIDEHIPNMIRGERLYLDRILLNLVSNALKFTHEGHVTIYVQSHSDIDHGKKSKQTGIIIKVEDSGIGIPHDKQEIIFEHFSRLTDSHSGIYKGAGLGLFTVKNTLEQMGGEIKVKSSVGSGSTFIIKLVFELPDSSQISVANTSSDKHYAKNLQDHHLQHLQQHQNTQYVVKPRHQSPESNCAHILIVEDSKLAALGLATQLEQFNCTQETIENGLQAIEQVKDKQYDLILLDMGLPDISGIEVAKRIRALSDTQQANIPIVAVTGHGDSPEHQQACHDVGIQKVLVKPSSIQDLQQIFSEYAPLALNDETRN